MTTPVLRGPLSVAAVQPTCTARDVAANAHAHAQAVRGALARVVVFPELSLTGYELDADCVAPDDSALAPIADACAVTDSLALVGAPVRDRTGQEFIAVLRIDAETVEVAYRKSWLSAAEAARFQAGPGPAVLQVDGWRIGLGICKDTGTERHVADVAALGVDGYAAGLVHRPEELPEQHARGTRIARACRAWVAFASFAGPTGDGYTETAGGSAVWTPDGVAVADAGPAVGGTARAVWT